MKRKFFKIFNLQTGEERKTIVLENIKSNIAFRGANLWILACAIVVASIGLNVNSTAVIIGAMLISPLMGPIVGAGFALAIYDFDLLKRSGKNLLIATVVSLIVATIYFFITPFKETQSELLARTSPNIYDVMIAFFGGLVGVIAVTRVEKGNPIPGVAIATALMPPLCTAGYGLAIGNFSYFLGAFYLYSINCFFICISTFLIVKYLRYRPVKHINPQVEKRIKYLITTFMIMMTVPSFYLAYGLFKEKTYTQRAEEFVDTEFTNKGYTVIYKKIDYKSSPKVIEVAFLTQKMNKEEIKELNNKLKIYELNNTKIDIKQDTKDLKSEILSELSTHDKELTEKDVIINNLQNELKSYKIDNKELLTEINILFPELKNVSFGRHITNINTDSAKIMTVCLYKLEPIAQTKKQRRRRRNKVEYPSIDVEKVQNWLKQKLQTEDVIIVRKEI